MAETDDDWPGWATHRIVIPHQMNFPPVVYFGREPRPHEVSAFARAGGYLPGDVTVEARA